MGKKRNILFFIILLLLTNAITFGITNVLTLKFDDKVIIPAVEYEQLYTTYQNYSKVSYVENIIKENYLKDVDDEVLLEGQLKGLLQSLEDPYSQYLTSDEYQSLTEQTSGTYGGIGVIVTPGDDNYITVVSPIEDTPGERAGLKTGDKIIKVDGKDYSAENMDAAVKVMKGEPNTKVTLTIMRTDSEGNSETMDIEIVREIIRIVTVKSNILDDKIGYIKITSFDGITYEDFKADLNELEKRNIEGLIIDLRNNPGGLLDVCKDIADELLGEGDIVYTETKDGNREYLRSDEDMIDIPLVILVNEGSASASEILAGAIRDHNRGVLIGTTTFGKGVVQRIIPFDDGSGIKLTISEYFTPNGINIHGIGIEPDIVVELPDDVDVIGVDNIDGDLQLQKAIDVIKSQI
ncbi:MAG: S41 family peptidase [Tissierellaceae bacterium]|jgi:carboxyl-terminal processing protease|nr:S41 family peptidase [Tissierellia bacterium]